MSLEIIKQSGKRPLTPQTSAFTQTFWGALAKGEFKTTRCSDCERISFPPRDHCPACWSKRSEWFEVTGRGVLYAQTTIHAAPPMFAEDVPYRVGIIDLEENVRLITRLQDEMAIGDAIELVVLEYEDGPLFAARPLSDGGSATGRS